MVAPGVIKVAMLATTRLLKNELLFNWVCVFGGGQTRTGVDRSRGIYSPLQLPLCDTPVQLLEKGIEPSTARLQVGCSTN